MVLIGSLVVLCAAVALVWVLLRNARESDGVGQAPLDVAGLGLRVDPPAAATDRAEIDQFVALVGLEIADGWWHAAVVGVTFSNDDGRNRQEFVRRARPKDLVTLVHDSANVYDKHAVRVLNEDGDQLGFLNRSQARQIVSEAKHGARFAAIVCSTGKIPNDAIWGMVIVIFRLKEKAEP